MSRDGRARRRSRAAGASVLRALVVLVALLAVGAALLLAVALRSIDPEELGRQAMEAASDATGLWIEAAEARFEPLRGLELGSATARGRIAAGELEAEVEHLLLEPRWWPLLTGRVAVDSLVLESPRIELRQRAAGGGKEERADREGALGRRQRPEGSTAASGRPLSLDVREARITQGELLARRLDGSIALSLENLDLTLAELALRATEVPGLAGLAGRGRLRADRFVLGDHTFDKVEGAVEVGGGRLVTRELGLTAPEGRFTVRELELLDPRPPWRWRAELDGDPLEIGRMIGGGEATGSLHLEVEARGTEATGRRGSGELTLDAGSLPAAPWVLRVAELLGRPELVGSAYEETRVEFTLEDDRVEIAPFELVGELVGLEGRGTAYLSGPLDLRLTVRTRREGLSIEDVPPQVLDLVTTGDGWVTVPLRIGGVLDDPVVRPDTKALGRVLRDAAKSRLSKALGGGGSGR